MPTTPTFEAWDLQTLAKFALDAYQRMQQQQEAIEQLRQDNKDLSKILREHLTNKDDWK